MPVALPDVLSVLAHELRSPLAVLQGYIRLLQRQRGPMDPESAMLTAMLDATGRLADIGRQASDAAVFLKRSPAEDLGTVPVHVLLDHVGRATPDVAIAACPDEVGSRLIRTANAATLATAIGAVALLAMREAGQRTVTVLAADDGGQVRLTFLPGTDIHTAAAADASEMATNDGPVSFDRGGLGLALVLASYVFDAHGTTVTTRRPSGPIDLRLPVDGEMS
jgi:hypothetical protein